MLSGRAHSARRASGAQAGAEVDGFGGASAADSAIAIISFSESVFSSEFEIQYEFPPSFQPTSRSRSPAKNSR